VRKVSKPRVPKPKPVGTSRKAKPKLSSTATGPLRTGTVDSSSRKGVSSVYYQQSVYARPQTGGYGGMPSNPYFDCIIYGKIYLPQVDGGPIIPPVGPVFPQFPIAYPPGPSVTPPIWLPGYPGGAPPWWGGGPGGPPGGPPGAPVFPIWGPPGFNPPGPGYPPGIWGGPIIPGTPGYPIGPVDPGYSPPWATPPVFNPLPPNMTPPPSPPDNEAVPDTAAPGFYCYATDPNTGQPTRGWIQIAVNNDPNHTPVPPTTGLPGSWITGYMPVYGAQDIWIPTPAGSTPPPDGGDGSTPPARKKHA